MPTLRVNYREWVLRVLTWDAALPAIVATVPILLENLFANRRGIVEIVAVVLPIIAFFLRVRSGRRHIAANFCSKAFKRIQFCVFCAAILPLVLIECFLTLAVVMPKGAMAVDRTDVIVFALFFGVYLTLMTIAMYPGRGFSPPRHEEVAIPLEEW